MALTVELVPFLEQLRELYTHPRGFARFKKYLVLIQGDGGEMGLPISNVNPMAKEHVTAYVEALIALDAEGVAIQACRDAATCLRDVDDALRLVTIVVDDVAGGWTNRAFTEFAHRYERKYEVQRGWVTVPMWTSEEPGVELVRERALEVLYRTVEERRDGPVKSLHAIGEREARASLFAGRASARYDGEALADIGAVVAENRDSTLAPVVMAALYGDEIARSLGYPTLGIPDRGGYDYFLAEALRTRTEGTACAIPSA